MHLVIGKGNLGLDLFWRLKAERQEVKLLSRSDGFEWPESAPHIRKLDPNYVWITAGHGSIAECAADFRGAMDTHILLPAGLMDNVSRETRVATFSTDYVASDRYPNDPESYLEHPKSEYALTKLWMERRMRMVNRPFSSTFRVGSLYGGYRKEKCFPAKLKKNFPTPCTLELPTNIVTPTPTWWLAKVLVENISRAFGANGFKLHHVAPRGGISTRDWGQAILGDKYEILPRGLDPLRPAHSHLGNTLCDAESWSLLWDESEYLGLV